ncbi:hypothetical protein LCGC14_2867610, partial [marine sediment metagenome]
ISMSEHHYSGNRLTPNPVVMAAAAAFAVPEMVDAEHRKKPVYEIARRLGVPSGVLDRRKYGLVSAFHEVSA